jgi:hypothetical protein
MGLLKIFAIVDDIDAGSWQLSVCYCWLLFAYTCSRINLIMCIALDEYVAHISTRISIPAPNRLYSILIFEDPEIGI